MRPRLTYANVMATVAVFIALGGASYAALKPPKNSVGTKQLRKNAVTGAKVKDNSLTGSDIDETTLGAVPNAVSASNAGNAETLGGQSAAQVVDASKLRCSGGLQLVLGVCFETASRTPTDLLQAVDKCREAERRLPTEGELIAFMAKNFAETPPLEWVEPQYFDGEKYRGTIAAGSSESVAIGARDSGESAPYRCVSMPAN